ncbi:MAG: hypothetical protein R2771_10705 [Saprospiraceae bacterium]
MKNQEKLHSYYLNKLVFIIVFISWFCFVVEAQNLKPNIEVEYANTLVSLEEYEKSSEIFNENINYSYPPNISYAVLANYKVRNFEYMDLWAKKLIANFYKNEYKHQFYNLSISENERDEIFMRLDSIFYNEIGNIIKTTDFEMEDKISSLLSVDQYFRINLDFNIVGILDSQYIFSDMMDLMLSELEGNKLKLQSKFAILIILIHQASYNENFKKMCDLNLIEKMLKENVITPYDYACIYDRNSLIKNEKMKYGTLYTWNYYQSLEGFNLEEINKNRLSIGLCELQFDYRNPIPLIEDSNEMKQQILTRLNSFGND